MWTTIPLPQAPAAGLVPAGVGCVGLGIALIVRGRSMLGRCGLGALAAAAGAVSAPCIAGLLPRVDLWIIAVSAAVAAGLLAFVLARLVWTVLLAALLAGVGVAVAALVYPQGLPERPAAAAATQPADWAAWLAAAGHWGREALLAAPARPILLAGCAGVLAALAFGVYAPGGTTVLASCGVGALAAVGGTWACVWAFRPDWAQGWLAAAEVPGVVAAALVLLGCIIQGRAEIRHRRAAAEAEQETESSA